MDHARTLNVETGEAMRRARASALAALRTVIDPEVGLDLVEMGLVYALAIDDETIRVDLTLSSRGCPLGRMIFAMAEQALAAAAGSRGVTLSLVWEPAWSPLMLGKEGRRALGGEK